MDTRCGHQAEDGIRDAQESRGLGDVYKRQSKYWASSGAFQSEQLTALINNVSPYYVVIGNDFQAALDACGLTKVVVEQII